MRIDNTVDSQKKIPIVNIFVLLVFGGLLIFCGPLNKILDSVFLLENSSETYWKDFKDSKREFGKLEGDYSYILNEGRNYIITFSGSVKGNDYSISVNDDGSISYSGKNNSDEPVIYVFCSGDYMLFPNGEYVYTDGLTNTKGISTRIVGIRYEDGGIQYSDVLSSSDCENTLFEITDEYDSFDCELVIEPGFSSEEEETILYPMVRKAGEKQEDYRPGIVVDSNTKEYGEINYYVMHLSKSKTDKFNKSDFMRCAVEAHYLYHNLKWASFKFEDGTGVVIPFDSAYDPVYGLMNDIGLIIDPISETEGNGFSWDKLNGTWKNPELSEIRLFESYIYAIKYSGYTAFASVRDEATNALSEKDVEALKALGLETEIKDKLRYSYSFVIDDGKVIYEECSPQIVRIEGNLDSGEEYKIESAGSDAGDYASIIIDGVEYSKNMRGFNIVVYDKENRKVVDRVSFDTFLGTGSIR